MALQELASAASFIASDVKQQQKQPGMMTMMNHPIKSSAITMSKNKQEDKDLDNMNKRRAQIAAASRKSRERRKLKQQALQEENDSLVKRVKELEDQVQRLGGVVMPRIISHDEGSPKSSVADSDEDDSLEDHEHNNSPPMKKICSEFSLATSSSSSVPEPVVLIENNNTPNIVYFSNVADSRVNWFLDNLKADLFSLGGDSKFTPEEKVKILQCKAKIVLQ